MIARFLASALIAAAMVASSALADDTTLSDITTDVRFHWQPAEDTVTITYFTGCLSAHGGGQMQDDIKAWLDRDYLQFDLQGRYRMAVAEEQRANRIGSADCMGSKAKTVKFTDMERETYVVNRHGHLDRNVVLADREIEFIIADRIAAGPKQRKPAMFLTAE